MKALITGASSGMGRDMATVLSNTGYDLILVARREDKLNEVKSTLKTDVKIICMDLSLEESCYKLYETVKNDNIDILINNAGFGLFGKFNETDLAVELAMIDINIKAVHILTKLFLKDFIKRDSGYILNVASSAGFMPGPLMSVYYATKAYVLRLSQAISEELRHDKSKVYIGALCPGPVNTEFSHTANVNFGVNGLNSVNVSKYAISQMFNKKVVIIPGIIMKITIFLAKFAPAKLVTSINYKLQKQKNK